MMTTRALHGKSKSFETVGPEFHLSIVIVVGTLPQMNTGWVIDQNISVLIVSVVLTFCLDSRGCPLHRLQLLLKFSILSVRIVNDFDIPGIHSLDQLCPVSMTFHLTCESVRVIVGPDRQGKDVGSWRHTQLFPFQPLINAWKDVFF